MATATPISASPASVIETQPPAVLEMVKKVSSIATLPEVTSKIIATVGPASWDPSVLEQMIAAGTDVFRLNFSHAGPDKQAETIAKVRAASERVGREVAVLGDLPGPKLRIGELRDDFAELETGMHVTLTPSEIEGDREKDIDNASGHRRSGRLQAFKKE